MLEYILLLTFIAEATVGLKFHVQINDIYFSCSNEDGPQTKGLPISSAGLSLGLSFLKISIAYWLLVSSSQHKFL